jgi:hypothetical protein
MSHRWIYNGHQDETTKILSIYCSKIIQSVPKSYIWVLKTRTEERSLNLYKVTDFDHPEDIKAFDYALINSNALQEKELATFYGLGRSY